MYRFFRRLLSANYWRVLFSQAMWSGFVVVLSRLHKDKRARKRLWDISRQLIPFLWCIAYLVWVICDPLPAAVVFSVLIVIALKGWYRHLNAPIREAPDVVPPHMYVPRAREAIVTPDLRREMGELALLHAVLADRAGSESFLRNKVLPEGVEVVTRRRHLETLRERGLYDRLGDVERDLLLLPDGHWEQATIDRVSMALEPVRLLRWVLRVDFFLPAVGSTMAADYKLSSAIVNDPEIVFRGDKFIAIEALRPASAAAHQWFYRCYSEGVRRGIYAPEDEEEAAAAKEYAGKLLGKEGDDFLIGAKIVSAASDADVRLAATLGLRRWQVLGWVTKRMYGEVEAGERLEGFYLR